MAFLLVQRWNEPPEDGRRYAKINEEVLAIVDASTMARVAVLLEGQVGEYDAGAGAYKVFLSSSFLQKIQQKTKGRIRKDDLYFRDLLTIKPSE